MFLCDYNAFRSIESSCWIVSNTCNYSVAKNHRLVSQLVNEKGVKPEGCYCNPGSRFFAEFKSYSDDNNLIMSDIRRLSDVHTYISDNGMKLSWVDHILSTTSLDSVIGDVYILDDVIVCDHKPVSFCLDCSVCVKMTASTDTQEDNVSWLPLLATM